MTNLETMFGDADDLKIIVVDDVIYLGNLIVVHDEVTIRNSIVFADNVYEWFKLYNVKNLDIITLIDQGYSVRDLDRNEKVTVENYKGMWKIIKTYGLEFYENSLFDDLRKKR